MPPQSEPPATVLVVDDVPANLGLLLDSLSHAGYRVLVAESGEGALAQIAHEIPDLILLDFMLPGMDGIEVCRRLKSLPACAEVPILFLTAVDDVGEKVRALEAGAVDYVTKPIQPPEVLARVRTHLRIARLQRDLEDELELRRDAEEQLRQSLDRALLVVEDTGRIQFATRLASTMLAHYFPGSSRRRVGCRSARGPGSAGPAPGGGIGAGSGRVGGNACGWTGRSAVAWTDTPRGRGVVLAQRGKNQCGDGHHSWLLPSDGGKTRGAPPRKVGCGEPGGGHSHGAKGS